jgi:hypothetical protein
MAQSHANAAHRLLIARSGEALAIAFAAGALALVAPPAALLVLALLAARALMSARAPRLELASLAAPLLAALAVGAFAGLAAGVGALFLWRVASDARRSAREGARMARAAGRPGETGWIALAHVWATPAFGVAMVAYTAPHMVAGLPLDLPHIPALVVWVIGALAALTVGDWALKRAVDWRLGELATAPAAHLGAHHVLFLLAYGLTLDVSAGLVAAIAWRLAHAAPLRAASPFAVS